MQPRNVYVPGDKIDEAREAIRTGTSPLHVAQQLGLSVEELDVLLGRPQFKTEPIRNDSSIDLWAADRAHDRL